MKGSLLLLEGESMGGAIVWLSVLLFPSLLLLLSFFSSKLLVRILLFASSLLESSIPFFLYLYRLLTFQRLKIWTRRKW